MDHVVFFPAHDGSPAFRRVASLDDAVRLVEHLRNSEGVDHVSVHQLVEVPLAFKAYYRVEMQGAESSSESQPVPQLVQDEPAPVVEDSVPMVDAVAIPVPEQAAPVEAEQAAPAPASLGFFAR